MIPQRKELSPDEAIELVLAYAHACDRALRRQGLFVKPRNLLGMSVDSCYLPDWQECWLLDYMDEKVLPRW